MFFCFSKRKAFSDLRILIYFPLISRHPMQIESLPPQNILTSNVVLRVLYRGNPTNVIGVGDLLTFRLEAKSQCKFDSISKLSQVIKMFFCYFPSDRYDFYNSDIFATNVIAKDPYTGRQVQLIDGKGCVVKS